tara:strand:+ start:3426 stop:3875 length:450 start_codon:yes stop_codon:yes gene_type:complete
MVFSPSPLSYGATEGAGEPTVAEAGAPEEDSYSKYLSYLNEAAPSLSILLAGQDPREREAVLESRLAQYQQLKSNASSRITQNYYTSQINEIQAELAAISSRAGAARETEKIAKAAKITGLVVVGLGAVVLLQIARYYGAKTQAARSSG